MHELRELVEVRFDYAVSFTEGVFQCENPLLRSTLIKEEKGRRHRAWAVIDRGVMDAWPDLDRALTSYFEAYPADLEQIAPPLVVEGGEAVKNDEATFRHILRRVHELRIDRHSYILAIGGGAVLDVVGYAAAVAHRGVRLVRFPTTVLGQADSGVGVKNGINAFGKKNFLGTFAPPFGVLCDVDFLRTLSARDRIAGMSEAIKVALVRDATFFAWLRAHAGALGQGDARAVAELVQRSAALHLRHIATSGDPFEMGSARPLDFGHWAAHKLESLTSHRLRHGEAVAIGMAIDTLYSARAGLCSPALADAVLGLLDHIGFRSWDDALDLRGPDGRPCILEGLAEFREHLGGELTVTLLRGPGDGIEVHEMLESGILAALDVLRARAHGRRSLRPASIPVAAP
ncbi:3-dehydroquinate synthase [Pendulispora albinea]|uniref:3-dehydroquinate synthase n=1 Tax=Pendulispora albinea TaxID=2741071 RepID=A0ABZ2LXZ3_9BACT